MTGPERDSPARESRARLRDQRSPDPAQPGIGIDVKRQELPRPERSSITRRPYRREPADGPVVDGDPGERAAWIGIAERVRS